MSAPEVKAKPAVLRMTLQITSKATGETREVEVIGIPEYPEELKPTKEQENGSDSPDSSS